jgi:hypothetical protein
LDALAKMDPLDRVGIIERGKSREDASAPKPLKLADESIDIWAEWGVNTLQGSAASHNNASAWRISVQT